MVGVECCRILQFYVVSGHKVRNLDAFQPCWVSESGLGLLILSLKRHMAQMARLCKNDLGFVLRLHWWQSFVVFHCV